MLAGAGACPKDCNKGIHPILREFCSIPSFCCSKVSRALADLFNFVGNCKLQLATNIEYSGDPNSEHSNNGNI